LDKDRHVKEEMSSKAKFPMAGQVKKRTGESESRKKNTKRRGGAANWNQWNRGEGTRQRPPVA